MSTDNKAGEIFIMQCSYMVHLPWRDSEINLTAEMTDCMMAGTRERSNFMMQEMKYERYSREATSHCIDNY